MSTKYEKRYCFKCDAETDHDYEGGFHGCHDEPESFAHYTCTECHAQYVWDKWEGDYIYTPY